MSKFDYTEFKRNSSKKGNDSDFDNQYHKRTGSQSNLIIHNRIKYEN